MFFFLPTSLGPSLGPSIALGTTFMVSRLAHFLGFLS